MTSKVEKPEPDVQIAKLEKEMEAALKDGTEVDQKTLEGIRDRAETLLLDNSQGLIVAGNLQDGIGPLGKHPDKRPLPRVLADRVSRVYETANLMLERRKVA